jgi:fumarate reductase flavoprotein subunit
MKTFDTDVVVMAAGPSGLCAAVQAAEDGAKVMVFEKTNIAGGAANMGMGPLAIGTKYQKNQMEEISVEKAFTMFMEYTHYMADANMVRKYFGMSGETIEWLEEHGVHFARAARYFPKSEATWHIVANDDGSVGRGCAGNIGRHLVEYCKELNIPIHFETPITDILMEGGKVCGVMAKDKSGEDIKVTAKAVIVATGGGGDDPKFIHDETGFTFNEDMFNFAIPGLKAEGVKLLRKCGADPVQVRMEMISHFPGVIDIDPTLPAVMNQPNLLVNLQGRRFMNEDDMQNTTFTGHASSMQKGRRAYSIFSEKILRHYKKEGLDVISIVFNPENLDNFDASVKHCMDNNIPDIAKFDTIEEGCKWAGIESLETLQQTIDDYNSMCETRDTQFFKDSRFMLPIEKGPYYFCRIVCGAYGTLGGVRVDEDMHALDKDWKPVPGLFVAGTDACNLYIDSYMFLLPGNTMGFAVNSGRIAGMSAADYIR